MPRRSDFLKRMRELHTASPKPPEKKTLAEVLIKGSVSERQVAVSKIISSRTIFELDYTERISILVGLEQIANSAANPAEREQAVNAFLRFAEDPDVKIRRNVSKFFAELGFAPFWSEATRNSVRSGLTRLKADSDSQTRNFARQAYSIVFEGKL